MNPYPHLQFSAGIGEHCASIRARICDGFGFVGIELNEARNAENAAVISTESGRVAARVIRTDEELMIARLVCRVLDLATAGLCQPPSAPQSWRARCLECNKPGPKVNW